MKKMQNAVSLRKSINSWIITFMICLVLSGLTAFPLETELSSLNNMMKNNDTALSFWINKVYNALHQTNIRFPFLAYGYDWLAFAHLVIAVVFIGPLRDPVRNIWVIEFGMIACLMIFPLAFIAGYVRHIPFYWQFIDCSFGIIGLIPLIVCYRKIRLLELCLNSNNSALNIP